MKIHECPMTWPGIAQKRSFQFFCESFFWFEFIKTIKCYVRTKRGRNLEKKNKTKISDHGYVIQKTTDKLFDFFFMIPASRYAAMFKSSIFYCLTF